MAAELMEDITVREIRKMLKDGVEVPEICKEFNIDPSHWREISLKYSFFK